MITVKDVEDITILKPEGKTLYPKTVKTVTQVAGKPTILDFYCPPTLDNRDLGSGYNLY